MEERAEDRNGPELEELRRKVGVLERAINNVMTLSLSYLPNGAILSAATSAKADVVALRATKIALQSMLRQVDDRLLAAVAEQAIRGQREAVPASDNPEESKTK